MKQIGLKLGTIAALALAPGMAGGLDSQEKCEAAKNKIAGKYAFCRAKAEAKAIKKGEAPDYTKCDATLSDKWGKAEQKTIDKGTECIDSVTLETIKNAVTWHTDGVAAALDGSPMGRLPATGQVTFYGTSSDGHVQAGRALSYLENGDGTITDLNTGLMWEKKDDSGGIHDKDNVYTWSTGTNQMNGTIVTTFLDTLNDVAGGGASCFAGYCDWRIPNVKEAQSIVDYEVSSFAVDPAFHQSATCMGCMNVTLASCSCTGISVWSSTTWASDISKAWSVDLVEGTANTSANKVDNRPARAVRGGL